MDKKLTHPLLAQKARIHLDHIINTSANRDILYFRLAGFYGGLTAVLKENKLIKL